MPRRPRRRPCWPAPTSWSTWTWPATRHPPYTQSYLLYAPFHKLGRHRCWGTPTAATAEKGRVALQRRIDASVRFIQETFAKIDRVKSADV